MGSKKNPLAYTGRVSGSTKVQGDVQLNPDQFSVTDGIVSLSGDGVAAINVATSVTSPLYTSGAGVDTSIEAPSGQDVVIKSGDAAGSNKVSFTDSGETEICSLDSDGNLSVNGDVTLNGSGTVLEVQGGAATDFIGTATLVLGTVTIANTNIAAGDKIFVQRLGVGASTSLGVLDVSINAGVGFTINALTPATPGVVLTADVSIVNYFIVRQI